MPLPLCAADAGPDIRRALFELWRSWALDPSRPVVERATQQRWTQLLDAWVSDEELPLLVRKIRQNRGSLLRTASGRAVIPTDNSPAQWAFAVACGGECPDISEVAQLWPPAAFRSR